MAYVIGIMTPDEKKEIESRGWEIEPPPASLVPDNYHLRDDGLWYNAEGLAFVQVWVDASIFEVMNGPDWEGGGE